MSPDPERIYLEPGGGAPDTGRLWCEDDVWDGDPDYADDPPATEYIRADLCPPQQDAEPLTADADIASEDTITLPVRYRKEGALRLYGLIATADVDGEKFAYAQAPGDGLLMFRIGDRNYEIGAEDLCGAVINYDLARAPLPETEPTDEG